MVKDKNKPKGPMSAYACFVQVIREEHKKKHPEESVVFSEFSKKCAEKWKTMTDKEKQRFDDMASRDKERYVREMDSYVPPDGMKKPKKRRRNKDPGQPKRALSAFFFFCEEKRPAVRAEHPDWKVGDIAKDLGRQWELCQCKGKYENQAMADKSRYEREMIEYRNGTFTITKRARLEDVVPGETGGMTTAGNGYPHKQENSMTIYNMSAVAPQMSTQSHIKPEISPDAPAFETQMKHELPASGSTLNISGGTDAVPHPAAFGHQNYNPTTQSTNHQPPLVKIQPQNFSAIMPQDLSTSTQSQSQLHTPVSSQSQQQPPQSNVTDFSMMQPRVTPSGDTADISPERNGGSMNVATGISQEANEDIRDDCAVDEDDDAEEEDDVADE